MNGLVDGGRDFTGSRVDTHTHCVLECARACTRFGCSSACVRKRRCTPHENRNARWRVCERSHARIVDALGCTQSCPSFARKSFVRVRNAWAARPRLRAVWPSNCQAISKSSSGLMERVGTRSNVLCSDTSALHRDQS
eukprot:6203138-Pleurochrysis_carterae.AAC.2